MSVYEPNRSYHPTPGRWQRALLRLLQRSLADLEALEITLPGGEQLCIGRGATQARLELNNWRSLSRLFTGGLNGWAQAYVQGDWDSSDLTALIRWGARQEQALRKLVKPAKLAGWLDNLYHWRRDNSRRGSRENIAAHYDLGNDFYRSWLDPSMTYSAALFEQQDVSLEQAQYCKNQRILEWLGEPGQALLEVGCGWGGFAEQAAQQGHSLRGVTLSREQLDYARQRILAAGLNQSVQLDFCDYRDIEQQYDALVSIEMFEAVGEAHWDSYFAMLDRVLKPGGQAVLQIITIDDSRFERYRQQADFIQRYIFPGGMLPSRERFAEKCAEHGFEIHQQLLFGSDYATTLVHWREAFESHWPSIAAQGFDESFRRLWRYYLCYCEGGFLEQSIDVGLFQIKRKE